MHHEIEWFDDIHISQKSKKEKITYYSYMLKLKHTTPITFLLDCF